MQLTCWRQLLAPFFQVQSTFSVLKGMVKHFIWLAKEIKSPPKKTQKMYFKRKQSFHRNSETFDYTRWLMVATFQLLISAACLFCYAKAGCWENVKSAKKSDILHGRKGCQNKSVIFWSFNKPPSNLVWSFLLIFFFFVLSK